MVLVALVGGVGVGWVAGVGCCYWWWWLVVVVAVLVLVGEVACMPFMVAFRS